MKKTLLEAINDLGLENQILYHQFKGVTHRQAIELMAIADCNVSFNQGVGININMKLFEYMAVDKPILCMSGGGANDCNFNLLKKEAPRDSFLCNYNIESVKVALKKLIEYDNLFSREPDLKLLHSGWWGKCVTT